MDNLKKVKRDRKRIALNQKHEMQYIRKIAREILKAEIIACEKDRYHNLLFYSFPKIKRLARAFLKLSSKKRHKRC